MELGIVGFPFVGKTTLFNALTRAHAETGTFGSAGDPNRAVVHVADPRLDALVDVFQPKKATPATVNYTDMGGLLPGSVQGGTLAPQFLATLRTVDALVHVVRAFEDDRVPIEGEGVDPRRDADALETEFLLADLQVVENRLERIERELRLRKDPELAREAEVLTNCREALEAGTPLRALTFDPSVEPLLRGFGFLTQKPLLLVLNIGEDAIGEAEATEALADWAERPKTDVVALCAEIEMELTELADEEAAAFRDDLGLEPEPALERLIRVSYDLMGVLTFFTANENEVRAWTIPVGSTALDAAGTVHSDMARGFIRAEVAPWSELVESGSYTKAREAGRLRLEGKEYIVQDGDVLLIRFNV